MKISATVALLCLSISTLAYADSTANTTTGTPTEACNKLVEAAKSSKYEEFLSWTTNFQEHQAKPAADKKFNKMHTAFMDKIKGIDCGAEHVGGKNAFVEAATGGETRFIPFINVNGTWKFDAKTYMSFYAPGAGAKGMKANAKDL